uniref:Secretin receptor n=1 Tax=Echeneis naucrates TaxID=173247 RepID=A0A665U441_ECHNA
YVKSSHGCQPHVNLVKEEEKCMKNMLIFKSQTEETNVSVHCKGMWDDLNCWPHASLGETVSQPCPEFFNSEGAVHRNCTASGWTDLLIPYEDHCFSIVQPSDSHLYFSHVKTMYTAGYTLSLISLTIAITVFCLFRKLHCTRNYIHIQLFISFILRAIFIFIRDALLFTNEQLYHCVDYPVACKVVLMFSNYSILANYSWLLAEGHFLFTLVSHSFFSLKKHLAWYIVLKSLDAISRLFLCHSCWETRSHEWIWWILRVPVLLTISVKRKLLILLLKNLIFNNINFSFTRRLIKSTFFLVALFGLHYTLFVFLPVEVSSMVFKIWTFAELALSSTQGFVVAVLYCFMNGEVQQEIQRRWSRWRLTQHLPTRRRQHHGSISHSGSPHTQVSLLPCPAGGPSHSGLPIDTVEI